MRYAFAPLLAALFALSAPASAQPTFATTFGSSTNDGGGTVAVDALGNTYVTGGFRRSVDFDPSNGQNPGVDTFSSNGGADVFVASYDPSGAFRWAFSFGDGVDEAGSSIATDGARVYVTGRTSGTIDFDPGPGTENRTANGGQDAFLAAYDAATGAFVWAGFVGSSTSDIGTGIATDGARVYATGYFSNTADFDPGPGTETRTAAGSFDAFLAAYDAATGAFLWADALGGTANDQGTGVATDGARVYATGFFRGTADFDPGAGAEDRTSNGAQDVYLAAYDAATGAFVWADVFGSVADEFGGGVATDGARAYVTGTFQNTVDFEPGAGTANVGSNGRRDAFLAAYDAATGAYAWAGALGGISDDEGGAVATDGATVYATGTLRFSADFDPGAGTATVASNGGRDAYLAAYDAATGAYINAGSVGGGLDDRGTGIAVGGGGIYATGYFQATADFDPGPGTVSRTSRGSSDIFLTSFPSAAVLPVELAAFDVRIDGAAGVLAWETASETSNAGFAVEHRAPNAPAFAEAGWVAGAGTTSERRAYGFRLRHLAPGRHAFRLRQVDLDGASTLGPEVEVDVVLAAPYALHVWPNPVGTSGTVRLSVARAQAVRVEVYDVLGRCAAVLFDGVAEGGSVTEAAVPEALPSGVYLVRAVGEFFAETVRVRVVR